MGIAYSNVRDPMKTTFIGGARTFVTVVNDFLKKVWMYMLNSERECYENFNEFKALCKDSIGEKIKALWSDNGGEFISEEF